MSDLNTALANVDAFDAENWKGVSWQLDRQDVLRRLRELLRSPDLMNQRGLNACGPAVFFRIWLARDPVGAAAFTCKLLRDGSAPIGSLIVAPSWKLKSQHYSALRAVTDAAHPNATPECTDWMLLSGLRDSENIWFDYAGEPYTVGDALAGITLPSTVTSWLSATNIYSFVQNNTNLVASGNRQQLLDLIPTSNTDTVLFVNPSAITDLHPSQNLPRGARPRAAAPAGQTPKSPPPAGSLLSVPLHYVLMTGPFIEGDNPSWIDIDVWSWGEKLSGWQGSDRLITNYFGFIVAFE